MVVWLIGLSGAGKSTLANEIVAGANRECKNTILLDGDVIREIFGNDLGYSMEDRLKNAQKSANSYGAGRRDLIGQKIISGKGPGANFSFNGG